MAPCHVPYLYNAAMHRRALLGTIAAVGVLAAQSRPKIQRKGRIKQGLWTSNFGQTDLTFEQLCAEAARLGAYGFDMRTPEQWPIRLPRATFRTSFAPAPAALRSSPSHRQWTSWTSNLRTSRAGLRPARTSR